MKHQNLHVFAASALAPLVAVFAMYLYVGTCGAGKGGFVLALKAGRVAVTAAWCAGD